MTLGAGSAEQAGRAGGENQSALTGLAPAVPPLRRSTRVSLALVLAGGVVSGALAGAAVSGSASHEIDQVEQADLNAAALSIPPVEAGTHIADAKACKVPLAVVTLRPHPGQGGSVRIRSGEYWSATIRLGAEPLRVAIPYPAPYETARGDLAFESSGAEYDVFLRPGWVSAGKPGLSVVRVWWTPKQAC